MVQVIVQSRAFLLKYNVHTNAHSPTKLKYDNHTKYAKFHQNLHEGENVFAGSNYNKFANPSRLNGTYRFGPYRIDPGCVWGNTCMTTPLSPRPIVKQARTAASYCWNHNNNKWIILDYPTTTPALCLMKVLLWAITLSKVYKFLRINQECV